MVHRRSVTQMRSIVTFRLLGSAVADQFARIGTQKHLRGSLVSSRVSRFLIFPSADRLSVLDPRMSLLDSME